jgi:hypothetical protein
LLGTVPGSDFALNDVICLIVGSSSSLTSVADVCSGYGPDASTSNGDVAGGGTWSSSVPISPQAVIATPTLSQVGMLLLSLLMAGVGVFLVSKRSSSRGE